MNTLTGLMFVLAGCCALAVFAVVAIFVAYGAVRLIKNRNTNDLAKVNVFDGLDASEMQIIAKAILSKKQADQEVKVRSDAVAALKI